MTSVHFRPASTGGAIVVCSPTRLLVFGTGPDAATVDSALAAAGQPAGLQTLLDLLTRNGLAATPPFALVDWADAAGTVRAIVRGDLVVTVAAPTGEQRLSGSGVSTWTERSLAAVSAVTVVVDGATAVEAAGTLPLREGAAWVAALEVRVDAGGASAPVAVSAAAPIVVPVVAPAAVPAAAPAEKSVPAEQKKAPAAEIDVEATRTDLPVVEAAPVAPVADPAESYDYLFGDTMFRSVADAAVHEHPEPLAESSEPDGTTGGDHDGHTVLTSDIAKLRAGRKARRDRQAPAEQTIVAAAPAQTIVLAVSTGVREALSQPILVGRSPSVSKVSGGQIPRLLTVGGADQDISRNHAQFALEGGTVVVTDLHSRNGTLITLPGKEPQKLRAGEPTSVLVGTVVDLGGGITLTVEED